MSRWHWAVWAGHEPARLQDRLDASCDIDRAEAMAPFVYLAKLSAADQEALQVNGDYREGALYTTGDGLLPKPCGVLHREGHGREVVHNQRGPTCSLTWPGNELRGPGATLVPLVRDGRKQARKLALSEVWSLQGGRGEGWDELRGDTERQREAAEEAVRAAGPQTTARLLEAVAAVLRGEAGLAGAC